MTTAPRTKANPQGPWEVAADFHIPDGFSDSSWHQDLNPSVACEATGNIIYWDTEDKANMKAEGFDGSSRFFVVEPEDCDTIYEGDDLQEAIRIARGE